jgi:Domain of unknown function (DUF4329)
MPAIGSFDEIYGDLVPDASDLLPDAGGASHLKNSNPTFGNSFEDIYGDLHDNAGGTPGPGNLSSTSANRFDEIYGDLKDNAGGAPGPGNSGPTSANRFDEIYGGRQDNAGGAPGPGNSGPTSANRFDEIYGGRQDQPSVPTSPFLPPTTQSGLGAPYGARPDWRSADPAALTGRFTNMPAPIARFPVSRGAGSGSGGDAIEQAVQPVIQPSSKWDIHYDHDEMPKVRRTSPFRTQDDAAIHAIEFINPKSIRENVEYGGLLYFRPHQGTYGYTGPTTMDSVAAGENTHRLPPGTELAGDIHTHGAHSRPNPETQDVELTDASGDEYASNNFSEHDLNQSNQAARGTGEFAGTAQQSQDELHIQAFGGLRTRGPLRFYLGTPSGDIRVHDPLADATEANAARNPFTGKILGDHGSDVVLRKGNSR